MTAADLARIAAAIERDAATEATNWPLSRERARLYIELARAELAWVKAWEAQHILGMSQAKCDILDALAALAPEEVPDAE